MQASNRNSVDSPRKLNWAGNHLCSKPLDDRKIKEHFVRDEKRYDMAQLEPGLDKE